jgi:hypothetical protein
MSGAQGSTSSVEVEKFHEGILLSRAFHDGRQSKRDGSLCPYVDLACIAEWEKGRNSLKQAA